MLVAWSVKAALIGIRLPAPAVIMSALGSSQAAELPN